MICGSAWQHRQRFGLRVVGSTFLKSELEAWTLQHFEINQMEKKIVWDWYRIHALCSALILNTRWLNGVIQFSAAILVHKESGWISHSDQLNSPWLYANLSKMINAAHECTDESTRSIMRFILPLSIPIILLGAQRRPLTHLKWLNQQTKLSWISDKRVKGIACCVCNPYKMPNVDT